ncbi:MAG: tripartite tricarboxylate transporter substrate binding protein [Pigmentiphaga sp.]|uniref:Bug family tripartite tricarboxylate transporter substrate binding protein n=1 Tax=Pigmentiphaga sp. TaxID=1977564 RepID=UPI0029BF1E97|nr:tripartite tricarboxylate transporter substrate binding protein [Pigmentiphaga sp.]MDX3904273.1 tripartite tricarboxylate transporter substrate binding protein [Pigmentiphaga sp.]
MKRIMENLRRRVWLALAGAAVSMPAVGAASYPAGPIRLIVPFQAGGLTDILARLIAERLGDEQGWTIVVENRPGAGGNIGAEAVARSAPDGLTLLMGSIGTNATNPFVYRNTRFDPQKEFAPVAMAGAGTLLLVVNPQLPIRDMKELLAYAKAHPGQLSYATGGQGASQHLAGELLQSMARIRLQHVPYKGIAPAMPDLFSGRVDMTFDMATVLPYVKQQKLRPIAVANAKRSVALPDVPTIAEAGVPGYAASAWYGVFAPARTPPEIIQRLNQAINQVVATPPVQERMVALGAEANPMSVAEFTAFVHAESAKWEKVLRKLNLQLD